MDLNWLREVVVENLREWIFHRVVGGSNASVFGRSPYLIHLDVLIGAEFCRESRDALREQDRARGGELRGRVGRGISGVCGGRS